MALGMVVMYLPTPTMLVPPTPGAALFGLAAGVLAVGLGVARLRGVGVGVLWLLSVVDLVWMAYMLGAMDRSVGVWSLLGAAWFIAQALGWGSGLLGSLVGERGFTGRRVARMSTGGPGQVAAVPVSGTDVGGDRTYDMAVRVSLTLMSAGMAYMLLAMRYGMAAVPGMPEMHHMPGMSGM
jgi:hypothetical protein